MAWLPTPPVQFSTRLFVTACRAGRQLSAGQVAASIDGQVSHTVDRWRQRRPGVRQLRATRSLRERRGLMAVARSRSAVHVDTGPVEQARGATARRRAARGGHLPPQGAGGATPGELPHEVVPRRWHDLDVTRCGKIAKMGDPGFREPDTAAGDANPIVSASCGGNCLHSFKPPTD